MIMPSVGPQTLPLRSSPGNIWRRAHRGSTGCSSTIPSRHPWSGQTNQMPMSALTVSSQYASKPLHFAGSDADSTLSVFPEGPAAIKGQELAGEYFEKAAPVIELQVAKAGYRLAAWLDLIAERMSGAQQDLGEL